MDSTDSYKTIDELSEGEFKDRGSKFFAYLSYIEDENMFSAFLNDVKSKHFKARHHCFGYQLMDPDKFRYSDDGEPSGTAGKPIYNQLISHELVNVACIVVRYFGGTKLGTSGLINAYKSAALEAINNASIKTKYKTLPIIISFDYGLMGNLMKAIKYLDLNIKETDFNENPNLTLEVIQSDKEQSIVNIKAYLLERSPADIEEETEVDGLKFD